MPCYFNGQITGDDRVSCSATPGKIWQSEPSLMSDPTTGQGLPMVGTTEAPMQNLTAYMIPGAGPAKQAATKALPYVKKGVQSLFTKPGVVQKTIPKMKQMADGTVKQIGTKTVDKAGRVMSVPRASATAIGAAGLYDNAVSPNPYGGAGPVMDRKVVQPPSDTAPTTPTTNKKNDGLLVDGLTGDDLKGVAESGDIPTSMWDKMQTKGYWLDGVEGGSGSWDNRLFRLGEMMAHMGTPLSKQGKSPAERWTTANTAANTLKATNAKASGISAGKATDAQRKSWVAMIPNETTLIKQFLKDKPGIISDSAPGTKEYANAASKAANYVWIGNQLIGDGIEPTPANIQKRAKKIKDEKK
jgi:hypothetical protein